MVFLKSMGDRALSTAEKNRKRRAKIVFDANVNHYDVSGESYYENMLPTKAQQKQAQEITRCADAVIADSDYLRNLIEPLNSRVRWIPDCIDTSVVPEYREWRHFSGRIPLVWSGQSLKLFELLAIESTLLRYRDKIELILVTNDMSSLDRWYPGIRDRFERLLEQVPTTIVAFRSIEHLFEVYRSGGVVISPRFLDNTYNLGHSEWKITLGMACGRFVMCDAVPSYCIVGERAENRGIWICRDESDWQEGLERILKGDVDLGEEGRYARQVVDDYYSASVIARQHLEYMKTIMDQ